ncbi:MAG TPA: hypothetical protein VID67_02345, partial [Rhizomicrobium sp.]
MPSPLHFRGKLGKIFSPIFRNNYLTGVTVVVYKTPNSRIAPEIQTRRESRGFSAFWAIPPIVIPG